MNLNIFAYTPTSKFPLASKILAGMGIGAIFLGTIGDGIAKKEACFYPMSAKQHDADVRLVGKGIQQFGTEFCSPKHRAIIPAAYFSDLVHQSSNPEINKWALLAESDTYIFREIPADNPYKNIFGVVGIITGMGLMGTHKKIKDELNRIRPLYRATLKNLNLQTELEISANQQIETIKLEATIKHLSLLKVAELQKTFLYSLTPDVLSILQAGMTYENYAQWGYLLDNGASFDKFGNSQPPQQAIIEDGGRIEDAKPHLQQEPNTKSLDSLIGARKSLMIVGEPGVGKSVTNSYMLTKFFEKFPQADCWVIAQKNDSFLGLNERGRVTLFDPLDPQQTMASIDCVYEIYQSRRKIFEGDRDKHNFKQKPVRLILADWYSINNSLSKLKAFIPYRSKIASIITVGREFNVCLMVDTQSYNVESLGLGDSNIRANLNILAQGNYFIDEEGYPQIAYSVVANIIDNHTIIRDDEERAQLREAFRIMKAKSRELSQPLIFYGVDPMRIEILPDLRSYKLGEGKVQDALPITQDDRKRLEQIYRLVNMLMY